MLRGELLKWIEERADVVIKARNLVAEIEKDEVDIKDVWDVCMGKIGDADKCADVVSAVAEVYDVGAVTGVPIDEHDYFLFKVLDRMFSGVGVEVDGENAHKWGVTIGLEMLLIDAMYKMGIEKKMDPGEWLQKCIETFTRKWCVEVFRYYVAEFEEERKSGQ